MKLGQWRRNIKHHQQTGYCRP